MLPIKFLSCRSQVRRVLTEASLFNPAPFKSDVGWPGSTINTITPCVRKLNSDVGDGTLIHETDQVDIYLQAKSKAYDAITCTVAEQSFLKVEEKYQEKASKIIEIFYSLDGDARPKELRPHEIDYLVKMKNHSMIKRFIKRLGKLENLKKKSEEKHSEIKEAILSKPKQEFGVTFDEEGRPIYKLHNVSPVCSYAVSKRIREFQHARIARAKLLDAPKIVIDFDYDQHMTIKQHVTITAQVKNCIGFLKKLQEPVDLYFCNFNSESPVARYLELDLGPPSSYLVDATSKSYLDLFPKEKLVYLTADTENIFEYDPDDIYIIGGMIDAQTNEPLSAIKSQKEGIRTAKLPLNEHVRIRNEAKSLKISQVFGIVSHLSLLNSNMTEVLEKYICTRIQSDEEIERLMNKVLKENEKSRQALKDKFLLTDEEVDIMILMAMYYNR